MPNNILSTIINADGSGFTKTLGELQAQLKRFEAGLKEATTVESFNRLNRAIDATKARITALSQAGNGLRAIKGGVNEATHSLNSLGRVVQDAPFGFIGISNNINPLLESFQRLKASTGTTGSAIKALGSSLLGAGGLGFAVSAATSLLVVFGDKLFGAAKASKESEEALKTYNAELKRVRENIDDISAAMQFANTLGSLNVKIRGEGDLQDLREQSVALRQENIDLQDQREKLRKTRNQITEDIKLNTKDREKALDDASAAIAEADKKILKNTEDQRILYRKIALQKIEDQKELSKKQQEDLEKALRDTISLAQKTAAFLNKNTQFAVSFEVDPNDTLKESFDKARTFLDKTKAFFDKNSSKLGVFSFKPIALIDPQVKIDPKFFKDIRTQAGIAATLSYPELKKEFEATLDQRAKNNPIVVKAEAEIELGKKRNAELFDAIGISVEGINAPLSNLDAFEKRAIQVGKTLQGVLVPAFGDFIGAISAGENPVKAFFESVKQGITQVIQKLASAIISALIFNLLLGKKSPGIGVLFKGFAGFRAGGGPVSAGKGYIVGENGPEWFQPSQNGRIISNNAIMNSGRSGMMPPAFELSATNVLRGRDIVQVFTLQSASDRRNT